MVARTVLAVGLVCCLASAVTADTLYLTTGVTIDGKVSQKEPGLYQVQIGDRVVLYQENEIDHIEQNDRTGVLDRAAIQADWEKRNQELTELTGLTADQRRRVESVMIRLKREDERVAARNELMAIHQEFDIFKYLEFVYHDFGHRFDRWVLETMCYIDSRRSLELVRSAASDTYYRTRAKAIELLGLIQDVDSVTLIARGLVDHMPEVRYNAVAALAALKVKAATPAFIELLGHPDARVSNAARESLLALWAAEVGDPKPDTAEQWNTFWAAQVGNVPGAFGLNGIEPLIKPEEEFQDE